MERSSNRMLILKKRSVLLETGRKVSLSSVETFLKAVQEREVHITPLYYHNDYAPAKGDPNLVKINTLYERYCSWHTQSNRIGPQENEINFRKEVKSLWKQTEKKVKAREWAWDQATGKKVERGPTTPLLFYVVPYEKLESEELGKKCH